MNRVLMAAIGAMAAAACHAQVTTRLEVVYAPGFNSLTPLAPTCRVRASAVFTPPDHAFAVTRFNVLASEEAWSNNLITPPLAGGGGLTPGVINGAGVFGIIVGQVHFPPVLPANPLNPMPLWEAEFTTTNFSPRDITLRTETFRFDVYLFPTEPGQQSRLSVHTEGAAVVRIVPAAGVLSAALAGVAVLARRRR